VVWFTDLATSSTAMLVLVASTLGMFAVTMAFLVAAWRLRRANDRKAAEWGRLETVWGEAIESAARGWLTVEDVHRRVQRSERLTFLDYLYKCVASGAAEGREALYGELAQPYLAELETRALEGDPWQRARAVRTIADLGGRNRAAILMRALDDPAPHVALTAARAYTRLRAGSIQPLLQRLDRFMDWDRRMLRRMLASFGVGAVPMLRQKLADETLPARSRAVCADALAELDDAGSNDLAADLLRESGDVDLRAAALRLIRPPATDRHRYLVRSLCAAEDPVVRSQAVACLSRIGDDGDLAEVERALADLSPWVVLSAARGLTSRRGDGAAGDLAGAASGGGSPSGSAPASPPGAGTAGEDS
jgi:HEAT repeat protein